MYVYIVLKSNYLSNLRNFKNWYFCIYEFSSVVLFKSEYLEAITFNVYKISNENILKIDFFYQNFSIFL